MTEPLDSLSRDAIAARLSGPPEARAALIREGAESGVAEAQAVHGQMLLDGGDAAAAFGWFNKAAAQGHLMALNMVGRCYDLGWGTAVNKRRAGECFRIAAERGLDWAMYNYATALALGDGVTEDRPGALAWFEKAAALGNVKAINHIGSFHEDGWVVARNMGKAAEYYARAAQGGDFRGAFNHARMLLDAGQVDEARPWLQRAAETGTPAFGEKLRDWLAASPWPELGAELAEAL